MQKILTFDLFVNTPINEQEDNKSQNEKIYSLIAAGVSRAFGLLGYFINLAQDNVDPNDWELLSDAITKQKSYDGKWKQIINISKRISQTLGEYSTEKYKDRGFKVQGIYDLGDESKTIPIALEKLKTASDILTKNLDEPSKQNLLRLIDKSVSSIKPFNLDESSLNESFKKSAPTATDVLMFAENLRADVINLKQTINNLSSLFPDSKLSGIEMMQKDLDPMIEQLERILTKDFEPLKNEKLARSVKKYYSNRGWDINTSLEQYMIEAWEKLTEFNKELEKNAKIVEEFRTGVIREYEPGSNVKQFIETANDILKKVEDSILKMKRIEYLKKRSGEVVKGSSDWTSKDKEKQGQQIKKADQLQDYLKKKYGQ
jgi:hypothetical protein